MKRAAAVLVVGSACVTVALGVSLALFALERSGGWGGRSSATRALFVFWLLGAASVWTFVVIRATKASSPWTAPAVAASVFSLLGTASVQGAVLHLTTRTELRTTTWIRLCWSSPLRWLGLSPVFGARHLSSVLESICNVAIARKIRADDRSTEGDRDLLVTWLREMRAGSRPFHAEQVRARVRELASTRLDYDTLRVVFEDDEFAYIPSRSGELPS